MALQIRPPSIAEEPDIGRFGVFHGFIYSINLIVGAGFLSLPWVYENGGWALCLII